MRNIEVKILNPEAIDTAEKMLVAMARLTQRGEKITNVADFEALLNKGYEKTTVSRMAALPHPTIQKFAVINMVIVGASRRFLAQITRHQNEVKFMSGSLQYSDYSGAAKFVVPYEITKLDCLNQGDAALEEGYYTRNYLRTCEQGLADYEAAILRGVPHDAAGYIMPQGMRNVLVISATPFQWKHMISQRICKRNSPETMYVMLKCWEALFPMSPIFQTGVGPSCMTAHKCAEGQMTCGKWLQDTIPEYVNASQNVPALLLDANFEFIRR